jgi:hypothetical protein
MPPTPATRFRVRASKVHLTPSISRVVLPWQVRVR